MIVATALLCISFADLRGEADDLKEPTVTTVYRSQFHQQVELNTWSRTDTAITPAQQRRFLGEMSSQSYLALQLSDLPEHRFVRLNCNLLMLKSVDGNRQQGAPDMFTIMTRNGLLLLDSSFCNMVPDGPGIPKVRAPNQSYPDLYPYANYPPGTGASEVVDFAFDPGSAPKHLDTVYPIELVFPHTGSELYLKFFSRFNGNAKDESWGLENVEVQVISGPTNLGDAALEKAWKALNGEDPLLAHRAIWEIIAGGRDAWRWIEERSKEGAVDVEGKFAMLLPGLEADTFKQRRAAREAITALGFEIIPLAKKVEEATDLPETRDSLRKIIGDLEGKINDPKKNRSLLLKSRVDHIRRIWEAFQRGYRISSSLSSIDSFGTRGAANDGWVPIRSNEFNFPNTTWWPAKEGKHWLQYDFPDEREITYAEVFWFLRTATNKPKSWEIQYLDTMGKWVPVETEDKYAVEPDKFNRVDFLPVTTKAVRLSLELPGSNSCAVMEFRVGTEPEPKEK